MAAAWSRVRDLCVRSHASLEAMAVLLQQEQNTSVPSQLAFSPSALRLQNQSSGTVTLPGCGAVLRYQTKHRGKRTLTHTRLCAIPIRFKAMLS